MKATKLWTEGGSFSSLNGQQDIIPMPTPCLKEFIAAVPSCTQKTALGEVLEIFEDSQCDRLVVVSEQQRPLGVLYLCSLLPYLRQSKGRQVREAVKAGAKKHQPRGRPQATPNPRKTASPGQLLSELGLSVITPVATLPADFTLKQFWPYLQDQNYKPGKSQDYALISLTGKFLGLLDMQSLLRFVSTEVTVPRQTEIFSKKAASAPAIGKSVDLEQTALSPLLQLLERLPLPIMLQTGSGQSVRRNLAWREHFDSLQDPDWLRREIAEFLETQRVGEQGKLEKEISAFTLWEGESGKYAPPASAPKLCHLGTNADSCTCVCPMQDGGERVWQFVKIRLGNVLSHPDLGWEEGMALERLPPPESDFRLANLMSSRDGGTIAPKLKGSEETNYFRSGSDLWLLLAQDVTESHRAAKELAAKNADLIQLNRLKDEFLACITHELKTPLTAIMGLSSLLKDRILGELNDRQARYARLIHQSGRQLMTIVNDILDLTRMETGQLELMLAPVDIATACDRAYQQARQIYLGKKHSDLEEQNSPELEPRFTLSIETGLDMLIADEMRLRQMLVHLLSNALKFTDIAGEIGLRVNSWEGWIAFTVWDTGIGIPEDKQHLIFQKFQQLENPLTRQFDGTGLGLVLTQRLVRLHGGEVTFTSKPGSGSEFTLLLPPSPPQSLRSGFTNAAIEDWEADEEPEKASNFFPAPHTLDSQLNVSSPSQSRLILVVESTTRAIEDLTDRLTSLGYRVVIARSGTEALEKARRLQPATIFLNPLLPLLSGWDVLTLLKASVQTQHIPVIVTASWAEKDYAFGKRADGFLTLPVQSDKLQQCLENVTTIPRTIAKKRTGGKTGLTILRLSMNEGISDVIENSALSPLYEPDLSTLLHQRNYRVLEADDLVQAELLARIWQPHLVLLEGKISHPLTYLEQLSEHQALARLPLITLDEATTQAALQVGNRDDRSALQVFPCLGTDGNLPEPNTLLQAIQVAAGICCKLSVLVMDTAMLPDAIASEKSIEELESHKSCDRESSLDKQEIAPGVTGKKKCSEWLQALIQYLQTAGLRVVIGRSWQEVILQARHRSVDLLLIDLGELPPNSNLEKGFNDLRKLADKPPTIVRTKLEWGKDIFCQSLEDSSVSVSSQKDFLTSILGEVATQIVPASLSMEELLERILQILVRGNGANPNFSDNNRSSVTPTNFTSKCYNGKLPSRWS